jgi:hypothetical protein
MASTRDQPVNSILKGQSGAGVVGPPLVLAGRAVNTASSAAGGHFETFDESVGLPQTGHSESLAWGASHLNR